MAEKFENFAVSTLAAAASATDTTLTLQAGHGARFPALSGGNFFRAVLFNKATLDKEIVTVTAVTGDILTCSALANDYEIGDLVENRATKEFYDGLEAVTSTAIQSNSFNANATDLGAVDAYDFHMTPTVAALTEGMPFVLTVGDTNTGACTLKLDDTPAKSIKMADGSNPPAGVIQSGVPNVFRYDLSADYYILVGAGMALSATGFDALSKKIHRVAAGTADTDAATIGGAETLKNKTLTDPTVSAPSAGTKGVPLDGVRAGDAIAVDANAVTLTGNGTLATATQVGHGRSTSDVVTLFGATNAGYNGAQTITVVDDDNFTYPSTETAADSANYAEGTVDAIKATYTPALPDLASEWLVLARAAGANTVVDPTFAPDGLTAKTITRFGGDALELGSIAGANFEMILRFNIVLDSWELLNPAQVDEIATDTPHDGNTDFEVDLAGWTLSDPAVVIDATTKFQGSQSMKIPNGESATTPHIPFVPFYPKDKIIFGLAQKSSSSANTYTINIKFYDSIDTYMTGEDLLICNVLTGNAGTVWNFDDCDIKPPIGAHYFEAVITATSGDLWVDTMVTTFQAYQNIREELVGDTGVTAGTAQPVVPVSGVVSENTGVNLKKVSMEVPVSGTLKVSFKAWKVGVDACYARLYRDGVAVGTNRVLGTAETTYTEDIVGWSAGDCLELWLNGFDDSKTAATAYGKELTATIAGAVAAEPMVDKTAASRGSCSV